MTEAPSYYWVLRDEDGPYLGHNNTGRCGVAYERRTVRGRDWVRLRFFGEHPARWQGEYWYPVDDLKGA